MNPILSTIAFPHEAFLSFAKSSSQRLVFYDAKGHMLAIIQGMSLAVQYISYLLIARLGQPRSQVE